MRGWTQPTLAIGGVKPFAVEPMGGAMKSALCARPPAILGLALLCLLLAGPGLSAELEIYQPRHRPAVELATLAQAMLGMVLILHLAQVSVAQLQAQDPMAPTVS